MVSDAIETAILQNSLFFSLLVGNLAVETGSTWTASATTSSLILQLYLTKLLNRMIGGHGRTAGVSIVIPRARHIK